MARPPVSGGPVLSKVLLVGQAPGSKEPVAGRPFAWTAGKTLFGWFEKACGLSEADFRSSIYMAAVCRCFPGKTSAGGDRVPGCAGDRQLLRLAARRAAPPPPELIIPVGKLAISQFLELEKLDQIIGRQFRVEAYGHPADLIPLPHPSGASPWHRIEPGKSLLERALQLIVAHPAWVRRAAASGQPASARSILPGLNLSRAVKRLLALVLAALFVSSFASPAKEADDRERIVGVWKGGMPGRAAGQHGAHDHARRRSPAATRGPAKASAKAPTISIPRPGPSKPRRRRASAASAPTSAGICWRATRSSGSQTPAAKPALPISRIGPIATNS